MHNIDMNTDCTLLLEKLKPYQEFLVLEYSDSTGSGLQICSLDDHNIMDIDQPNWASHISNVIFNLQVRNLIEHVNGSLYRLK